MCQLVSQVFFVVVYGKVEQLSDRWQRWNVACRWTRDFPIPLSLCRLVFGSGGSFVHQMETKSKGECVWYRSQTHITHSTRVGYFRLKRRGGAVPGPPSFLQLFLLSLSLSLFLSYFFVPERERRERTLFLGKVEIQVFFSFFFLFHSCPSTRRRRRPSSFSSSFSVFLEKEKKKNIEREKNKGK